MSFVDAIDWTGTAIVVVAFGFAIRGAFGHSPEHTHVSDALYAMGNWLTFLASVIQAQPLWTAVNGLLAAFFTWRWWNNRRKGRGRKALRELGAKSRARVQALVDQMTPSPIPVPGGAA